jgi:hypothetical protein
MGVKKLCTILFAPALALATTIAHADWVRIDFKASDQIETFIDTNRIRQSGPMNTMRRVWELSNLPKRTPDNALSVKSQIEYDCKDRRVRSIEAAFFAEHFAQGEPLAATNQATRLGDWRDIGKGGTEETIFDRVCPSG